MAVTGNQGTAYRALDRLLLKTFMRFPELATHHGAQQRIIASPQEVVRRAPDTIIGPRCGRRFQPGSLKTRPGWDASPALRNGMVFETKSGDIFSPGSLAIMEGLRQLGMRLAQWPALQPEPA
jgi:iron complex transport system substrate-binding protein